MIPADNKLNIVAMIPARMGSVRLAKKNLALINGKPLIYYAIKAAKDSAIFKRIVVNSEHETFSIFAKRYGVEFYKRPAKLATSKAKSDYVLRDFIKNHPSDVVVWVNPTSPLQTGGDIRNIVTYFIKNKLDTLITVRNEQVHCIYKSRAVNFNMKDVFAKTQDLIPVQSFVYSVMIWKTAAFVKDFNKNGHAFFCGKTSFYPVGKLSAIIIKKEEDLMFAEYMMKSIKKRKYEVRYDKEAAK